MSDAINGFYHPCKKPENGHLVGPDGSECKNLELMKIMTYFPLIEEDYK